MTNATEALDKLRDGNARFVGGNSQGPGTDGAFGDERAEGQTPFAIVLSCSDSRVPPEIIFDQGVGDLFVIRVAGNVVEPSLIGSVEYAASVLGTSLVVVLGHSNCGAVTAALGEVKAESSLRSPNLLAIVDSIRPSINSKQSLQEAITTNVAGSVKRLKQDSLVLNELVAKGDLAIVGAEYSIETGKVTFDQSTA